MSRSCYFPGRWVSTSAAWLIANTLLSTAALAESKVLYEFQVGRDYDGPVQRVAFDRSGNSWISTPRVLYRVEGGKLKVTDFGATADTQLALAPTGGLYAWLVNGNAPGGLFTVELWKFPKKKIGVLRLPEFPYGFGTLYLGGAGELIVTATPLASAEGLGGDFLYAFWSSNGKLIGTTRLAGPRNGVVDADGSALLLLGESDAIAFRRDGTQLWKLDGSFRKGALASKGMTALLNPAQRHAIDEVHVYRNGRVTPVKLPAPIHDLALTPDGSEGAVAIDQGKLFFVAPRSCEARSCKLRAGASLPVTGTHYISAVHFLDAKTIAVGVFQATGTPPNETFDTGAIFTMTTTGQVKLIKPIKLAQPATWSPLIDVTYGVLDFAAYTPEMAVFVRLDR